MDSGVFLLQPDNSLVRMDPQAYDAERLLQQLLTDHPELLAGDQIDPESPRRFLLVQPEIGVPDNASIVDRWYLDHLFIDQDAIPTLVEVKRASDTRIRREVVAQMLDYAANATEYWPIEGIRARFTSRCQVLGIDSELVVSEFLGPESDPEEFWQAVKANLSDGRLRLIFVADQIPQSLRRIVEFLNRQMSPAEVLALEVRQFAPSSESDLRTLVPRVIGQTEQARQHKAQLSPGPRREPKVSITRGEFLEMCAENVRSIITTILDSAERIGYQPEYSSQGHNAWVSLAVPGVSGAPLNLWRERFWISLGRYHKQLRNPEINQALRYAILRLVPSNRPAVDPRKTEVGIRYDQFERDSLDAIDTILVSTKSSLTFESMLEHN